MAPKRDPRVQAALSAKHAPLEITSALRQKFSSDSIVYIRVCKQGKAELAMVVSRLNFCLCTVKSGKMLKVFRFDELRGIEYRKVRSRLFMVWELCLHMSGAEPDIVVTMDQSPLNTCRFDESELSKLVDAVNTARRALGLTSIVVSHSDSTAPPPSPPPSPLGSSRGSSPAPTGLRPSEKLELARKRQEEEGAKKSLCEAEERGRVVLERELTVAATLLEGREEAARLDAKECEEVRLRQEAAKARKEKRRREHAASAKPVSLVSNVTCGRCGLPSTAGAAYRPPPAPHWRPAGEDAHTPPPLLHSRHSRRDCPPPPTSEGGSLQSATWGSGALASPQRDPQYWDRFVRQWEAIGGPRDELFA